MAKRKWSEAIDRGIAAYRTKDYVYIYGAKNVRLTSEAQIRHYFAMEPAYFARYSESEKSQIVRNSLGHIAADCSGFTGWVCTGDKQYSFGQINNCYKYNSLAAGPSGSVVFTTWGGQGRHIGLDSGNGWVLHIGYESTDANIAAGRAGIVFEPIVNRAWERSGQSNVLDYSGAYSPYGPTTDLIAEINGGAKTRTGRVITDLYLRAGAGVGNKAILVLPAGAVVSILGSAKAPDGGTWYFLDFNGTTGYSNSKYIKTN